MKISLRKRIIAFMLSVILLFSGSISGFASELLESDPMAEAAAAVVSEEATEPATEAATEATETSAAIISEEITEATEAVTEEVTEAATEAVTEEATEAAAKEETVEETEEEIVEETETETVEETEEETEESEEESEEETQVLEYEDDDVKIHVSEKAEGAIPKDASLKVTPITESDKEYNEVEKQLNEKAEGEEYEIAGFLAYDITFIDKNENKVEPNGEVAVSMEYKKAVTPVTVKKEETENTDVTVMHLEENSRGEIKEVVDMVADATQEAKVTTTADAEVEKAVFVTDSFSVFTIVWTRVDDENPELSFENIKQEVYALSAVGTSYEQLNVNIIEGDYQISSKGTPPTLYIDTITESGENKALYKVEDNGKTYRFVKAIVCTWKDSDKKEPRPKTIERVVAVQAIKVKGEDSVSLRYMLEDTGRYTEFENGDFLAFVYTDGALTTKATYWTEEGDNLLDGEEFDFSTKEGFNTTEGEKINTEEGVEILHTSPFKNSDIRGYTYSYVAITQFGDRVTPRYIRYYQGNLQYSMSETDSNKEWTNVGDAEIRLIYKLPNTVKTENTQGIVDINMFDYTFAPETDGGNTMGYVEGIYFGTGWQGKPAFYNQWTGGVDANGQKGANLALQGMVEDKLIDGYPKLASGIGTGGSLAGLFNTSTSLSGATGKTVYEGLNHFFVKDGNGYYSFDSSRNYAYYSSAGGNKNVTIYDRPVDKAGGHTYEQNDSTRGDFMPFVPLGQKLESNTNDEQAYHLGMTIGFNFVQPEGQINGNQDMIFRFSGDDDVWVFIDGQLVLDIGGIHSEAGGSINFTTGDVEVYAGPEVDNRYDGYEGDGYGTGTKAAIQTSGSIKAPSTTTLKEIFKLSGITFEPNSFHRLEFFYLERGADLSNCEINFNLQPVNARSIEVEKEIVNTDKANYGDVEFTFELNIENSVDSGKYDKIPEGTKYTLTRDDKIVGTREVGEYGRFVLKHGESAIFENINSDLTYYVREVSVSDDGYDKVEVNGSSANYFDEEGNELNNIKHNENPDNINENPTSYIAKSATVEVGEVYKMLFQNTCAESNKRELHIQKLFKGNLDLLDPKETFTFKVMLEDRDGNMVPYKNGEYFIMTDGVESEEPLTTTTDGIISGIKVDQTVIIKELMQGTDFYVEEVELEDKYQKPEKVVVNKIQYLDMEETEDRFGCINSNIVMDTIENVDYYADGVIVVNKDAKVEITNALKFDWELIKISSSKGSNGETLYLEGAEFKLESTDGTRVYTGVSNKIEEDGPAVVNWNVPAKDIEPGTYILTETKAPAGYFLTTKEWTVVIDQTSISIKDGDKELSVASTNEDGTVSYTITIANDAVYELPSTGGFGIYWYMIAGTVMMMAATAITYKNRREEVLERTNR